MSALSRADWILISCGAVLVTLAYPPFHLFLPSFVCLAPAVALIVTGESDARPLRRHLAQGCAFGIAANALALHWIAVALWRVDPLAVMGYPATVALLAAYWATCFALVGWVRRRTGVSWLVAFPLFWTATEWAIGHQGDLRFPWLGLGTSLTGFPTVVQVADLVGARGITLLLATANTALALAWLERSRPRKALTLVGAVVVGLGAAVLYGMVRERQIPLRTLGTVALVQPNVPPRIGRASDGDARMATLIELSGAAIEEFRPGLVVWPEAAVPDILSRRREWDRALRDFARRHDTPVVLGAYDSATSGGRAREFNAAFLFEPASTHSTESVYRKRYLVPFIERVPFVPAGWLGATGIGGFSPGGASMISRTAIGQFGVLICYESAFEDLSREHRMRGADFLVNVTNDVWFGRTSGAFQHAAHLVMRAIENRVGIVRAANSGISLFVDPFGRTHDETSLGVRAVVSARLRTSAETSWYSRSGDWVGRLVMVLAVALLGYARWTRR